MNVYPLELRRDGESALTIRWSDGLTVAIPASALRHHCPCATCQEARSAPPDPAPKHKHKHASLRVVSASSNEELALKRIWGVGNYALGVEWGDRHAAGIYTYSHLRELSEQFGEPAASA